MSYKYRNAAHYLAGILTCFSYILCWVLPVIGLVSFITYELNEDRHLTDQAYKDILEYLVGFFVTVAGLITWRFVV